jgi:hypothetical protein
MELVKSTNLEYVDHRSDKVYRVKLVKTLKANLWNVHFAYGRRHSYLTEGRKNPVPLSFELAFKEYNKLVNSKTKKGYTVENRVYDPHRERVYTSFANELLAQQVISQDDHSKITKLLYSNDQETVRLAELLIETKEAEQWERN